LKKPKVKNTVVDSAFVVSLYNTLIFINAGKGTTQRQRLDSVEDKCGNPSPFVVRCVKVSSLMWQ